ncbi:winged helix-turn-helix domain-containing protein [Candidatus Micrarchaeota archaeon]|jgi:DNA-binding transcriptional ArsR family regulator|nr:winged helix-turn-helix domain-containing protein [Candidatus Micrarchaeota archaeon]
MKKRNFKLYFTFAIIVIALAVFFSIEYFSLPMQTAEPFVREDAYIEENFFEVENTTVGASKYSDKEVSIEEVPESQIYQMSYIQIIKYISLIIIGVFLSLAGYQIFYQRSKDDLLSNDLRMNMLLELREADKIPTYFSDKFRKSKSTISEHLDKLVSAGLVEKVQEPGKKFVYYRITREGKSILRNRRAA